MELQIFTDFVTHWENLTLHIWYLTDFKYSFTDGKGYKN